MASSTLSGAAVITEKSNYIRLSMLLVDIGTDVLRLVFDSIHPPSTLHGVLNSPKVNNDLQKLRTNKVLYTAQWDTLYPTTGGVVTSKNFDITLLFLLLRNICTLTAPLTGWTSAPLPTDLSMSADLVRIKSYRNEIYAHRAKMALTDMEFEYLWSETEAALIRLGKAWKVDYTLRIQGLKVEPLDAEKEKCFNVLLQSWEEGEEKILDAMQNLSLDNERFFHALQETQTKASITINGIVKAAVAGGTVVAWAAGSAYFLSRYRDDPETVIRLVQGAIIPASLATGAVACVLAILPGSFKIVVEIGSLQGLELLWKRYAEGQLREDLEEVIVTDKLKRLARTDLNWKSKLELSVTISVDDYKKASDRLKGCQTGIDESFTYMYKAIEEVNVDTLQELIKSEVDVNASDGYGRTPLWYCVEKSLAITEASIKSGASVNLQYKSMETAPIRAVVIKAGTDTDVNLEDTSEESTPMIPFIMAGTDTDVMNLEDISMESPPMIPFTMAGADALYVSPEDISMESPPMSPMAGAISDYDFEYTESMETPPVSPFTMAGADASMETPPMRSLSKTKGIAKIMQSKLKEIAQIIQLVTVLLISGADVNIVDKYNETVLSHVLRRMKKYSDYEMRQHKSSLMTVICKLAQYGADVNVMDDLGRTALWYAARLLDEEATRVLIKCGADINLRDEEGMTPLTIAVANHLAFSIRMDERENEYTVNHKSLIKVCNTLITAGADVNMKDKHGKTPLMHSSERREFDIVQSLLLVNAEVNLEDEDGMTALCYAIEAYATSIAIKLIENGADIRIADKSGKTALMYAAHKVEQNVLEALITNGAQLDAADERGKTALIIAAVLNNVTIVNKLIADGADMNVADNEGMTALAYAVGHGQEGSIRVLLAAGADVNVSDNKGRTILMLAIQSQHLENKYIFAILEKVSDLHARDSEGKTALMLAAKFHDSLLVERLLKDGANPNVADEEGKTALMLAAESNRYSSVVQKLVDYHADVNSVDKKGKTALMFAGNNLNYGVVQTLIRNGADLHMKDEEGRTALMIAAMASNIVVLQILIDSGALVDVADDFGRTTLMYSTRHLHEKVLQNVLQCGANPNAVDTEGNTALMLAANNPNELVVQGLITSGADVNLANKDGKTALVLAAKENPNPKVVKALIDGGADTNATDRDGKSAIDYASANENEAVLEVFND